MQKHIPKFYFPVKFYLITSICSKYFVWDCRLAQKFCCQYLLYANKWGKQYQQEFGRFNQLHLFQSSSKSHPGPPKNAFFSIFWQTLTPKLSIFIESWWWKWLAWVEGYRGTKFQSDCFFHWWVIWVQSWENLACS